MPSNGSWQKVRFDQICKNISNRIDDPKQADTDYYVGLEHLDSEEPKILRHGSPQDVSKTKLLFKPGHILFGKRNWYLRRLAVAEREGVCSAHMLVLEPIEGKITKEFLPLLMFSDEFYEKALMVSAGSMSPTIKWKDICKLEFLIPPIPEQETILSLTHQINDSISKTQSLLQQTKIYSISKHENLLTRGIRHKKFKKVKWLYGKTIEIPEEWDYQKVGVVSQKVSVGIATSTTKHFVKKGVPLLRNQNIEENKIETNNLSHISEKFSKMNSSKQIKEGDIICVRTGYPGQSAVVTSDMNGWQTFTTLIITPNKEIINSHYLSRFLNSSKAKKQIKFLQAGTGQQNLNARQLYNLLIPVPPLPEQKEIISITSNINEQISQQQSHLSNLKTMRKSILNSKLTKEETIVAN